MSKFQEIVEEFSEKLREAVMDEVLSKIGATTSMPSITVRTPRGPGRPPGKPRKKPPIQYCPVPRCKNRAAPVFNMVCSTHKDLPKAKIKKYREARKLKASGVKPARKPSKKVVKA